MAWLPPSQVYGPPIPPNTPMNPDGTFGNVPTAADWAAGFVSAPPRPPDDVLEGEYPANPGRGEYARHFIREGL